MRRASIIVVAVVVTIAGCKGNKAERKTEPAATGHVGDAGFIVARPRVTDAPAPARFMAPLPSSVTAIDSDATPPRAYIRAALERDTAGMRDRLLAAVKQAHRAGTLDERLRGYYASFVGYLPPAGVCAWLAATATSAEPPEVRAPFWEALAKCQDPALAATFARDDAPPAAVVEWYFEHTGDGLPFRAEVARAVAGFTGGLAPDADYEWRKIGFVFAAMAGPQSISAFEAFQRTIEDPAQRARIAVGMLRHPDAAAFAIGKQACMHPDVADDTMCSDIEKSRAYTTRPEPTKPDEIAREETWDPAALAKLPRAEVVAALESCVGGEPGYQRRNCLVRLATVDRPAAVALAAKLRVDPDETWLARVVAALRAYPEAGVLERELAALGFTPIATAPEPEAEPAIAVEDVLEASGRVHGFDTETGQFPNEHDELMAELAALARPALDGAFFEEVPPAESEMDTGRYLLRAYAGGKRYELPAQNLGDYYDVEAVIGLLNAVLVAEKSELRFVVLPTGDQTATVLAGPGAGIRALVAKGLVEVGDAGAGATAGKEFEDRVFEQLQREGKTVHRDVGIGDGITTK